VVELVIWESVAGSGLKSEGYQKVLAGSNLSCRVSRLRAGSIFTARKSSLATAAAPRNLPPLMKPKISFPSAVILAVALLGLVVSGCETSPPSARSTPVGVEPSARPGVNAEYLKPDLDVTQWVERFEREGREIYDHRAAIVAAARLKPGMVMADIGAGTGLFTPSFSRAVGPKGKVHAVDIVPAFLDRIKERAAAEGLANVQTVLGTERSVELPPNSIDFAFICDVYHHFEYPQSSLASLHRALRPGGEVLLVEFKRVPGKSSDWVLNHVRAGQEVFTAEIVGAGFQQIEEQDFLKDNYVVRFRKLRK
jgi:ubiquinone/menaquinone biosynthesis C-methylase UbiE